VRQGSAFRTDTILFECDILDDGLTADRRDAIDECDYALPSLVEVDMLGMSG